MYCNCVLYRLEIYLIELEYYFIVVMLSFKWCPTKGNHFKARIKNVSHLSQHVPIDTYVIFLEATGDKDACYMNVPMKKT